jgi:hypothetical protein
MSRSAFAALAAVVLVGASLVPVDAPGRRSNPPDVSEWKNDAT